LSKQAIRHIEEAMLLLAEAERFAVSNDIDFVKFMEKVRRGEKSES